MSPLDCEGRQTFSCEDASKAIPGYIAGEELHIGDRDLGKELEHHIDGCQVCREVLLCAVDALPKDSGFVLVPVPTQQQALAIADAFWNESANS